MKPMIRIFGPRGSGKTTKLLNLANENGYVLVEPNKRMADCARHMAIEKGYTVNVISSHELLHHRNGISSEKYLIDELELFLMTLGVEGYSEGGESERIDIRLSDPRNRRTAEDYDGE